MPPTSRGQFLRDSTFAVRGKSNPIYFSWRTFNAHLRELKRVGRDWLTMISNYIFWQYPYVSSFMLVLYQVLVSNPLMLPAAICFGVLAGLVRALITKPDPPPIDRNPPVSSLCTAVLVGGSTEPLLVGPECWEDCESDKSEGDSDSDEEEGNEDAIVEQDNSKLRSTATKETRRTSLEALKSGKLGRSGYLPSFFSAPRPTLQEELDRLRTEVIEELEEEQVHARALGTAVRPRLGHSPGLPVATPPAFRRTPYVRRLGAVAREPSLTHSPVAVPTASQNKKGAGSGAWLFPLAKLLSPVQQLIVHVLMWARLVNRVIAWDDPAFSLLISAVLFAIASVLWLAAWLLHLLPWSLIIEWLIRLLGVAVLGPHMYWVGKWVEKQRAEAKRLEAEFATASDSEREAILATHKERLMAEARAQLDKEMEQTRAAKNSTAVSPADQLKKSELLAALKGFHKLMVRPRPTSSKLRFYHRPVAKRSQAYALLPSEDRPELSTLEV